MKSNRFWVFAFWFYFGILMSISISAYLKIIPVELSQFPYFDTIMHFLLLGIAAYLGHLALNKRKIEIFNISLPLTPFLVIFFCIVDEIIQLLTPHRSFDLVDLAADLFGVVLFTFLAEIQNLHKSQKNQI
ncbi:antibiotic resistance protein VanZ [Nostoc linckia z18]|jgi:VanZ family protein|uniref:Antibiotic resistance protein VanZ n=2 Tax=Nostoc linckia TaxID=92942 RepID=A0A9Q6ELK0_NOSLI|nr:VanZ family protein [Nostoc linckia]MBL1200431.1 VanZ family protein [Nostoc sp. GBBB01]PHK28231.1 antibiotic resistance protein VanZ [Nostoc linckia z15]PHK38811.1 antibiotic resistance protein VanZ [Nostoc linckia z16]PHJ53548.1 antibiotic resistance protein VanZ [Nostoc linckia z1]PHJ56259.1 antibiotic resistance protein VanZ [Nostoc linckia z3]